MCPLALLLLIVASCDDGPGGSTADAAPPDDGVLSEPLSMPARPTHASDQFNGVEVCAECHPRHAAEWKTSMHAYAIVDPVFQALVRIRQQEREGREDRFCLQCHSAIGTRAGEFDPGFDFDAVSPIAREGVTCEACHKIASVERPFNAGHVLDPDGPMRGTIEDPAPSAFHETEYAPLFGESRLCGSCHDVREVNGLPLERPFGEWDASPGKRAGETCQGCHMPEYTGTTGGPERTLHSHRFVGADLPLSEFVSEEERDLLRGQVEALLRSAASLELTLPERAVAGGQIDAVLTVRNEVDAHDLPTGTTFVRQVWVELVATDADGTVLYATGDLDENGDLRDHFSDADPYGDEDLVRFGSTLLDERGSPTVLTWHAAEHVIATLPPAHARTFTLFVPTTPETRGPVRISARLRFRSHPPFLLRLIGLPELLGRLEIHDMAEAEGAVPLDPRE